MKKSIVVALLAILFTAFSFENADARGRGKHWRKHAYYGRTYRPGVRYYTPRRAYVRPYPPRRAYYGRAYNNPGRHLGHYKHKGWNKTHYYRRYR